MAERLTLVGYRYSVYTRIVRMALMETGLAAAYLEVDPFRHPSDPQLTGLTPFGRVPVLRIGDRAFSETAAIVHLLADLAPEAGLVPRDAIEAARMRQVIGIVDSYAYIPLVRQVFAHAVFAPLMGEACDPAQVALGVAAAPPVLRALDGIAQEDLVLGETRSLADLYLAPMIDYFLRADAGRALLADLPHLAAWWRGAAQSRSLLATDPFIHPPG